MKAKVITLDAKDAGEQELHEAVFGLEERKDILHRMVEYQRAKRQAGTHKTKVISEIRGTTAKPFKQKGTGRARQGSRRAAQMVGGVTIFGPVGRTHAHSLTKKFRKLALRTALSAKKISGELIILKDIELKDNKTSSLVGKLKTLAWQKPLIVDNEINENFSKAAANIKNVDVLPIVGINVYDILRHRELVLTQNAVVALEARLK